MSQARRKAWNWMVKRLWQTEGEPRSFSAHDVAQGTGMNLHTTKRFIQFLREKGKVKIVRRGKGPLRTLYTLVDVEPLEFERPGARPGYRNTRPHRRTTARQRIWNSCRILRVFCLNELAATSMAAYVTAGAYVKRLEKAGLVRKVKRHAAQPGEYALFRLNLDAGPEQPIVRDDGVYCPSIDKLYPYKGEHHEGLD